MVPDTDAIEAESLAPTVLEDDPRADYRLKNRLKQRKFRARYQADRAQLQAEIDELSAVLAIPPPLAWSHVAAVFASATKDASRENLRLRAIHARRARLAQVISRWVTASAISGIARTPSISRVTLLADENARKLGVDWITTQWYCNTDRMLSQYGFPGADSRPIVDFNVQVLPDDTFNLYWRIQRELPLSLDAADAALSGRIQSLFRGDSLPDFYSLVDCELLSQVDPTLLYRCGAKEDDGETDMFLSREFRTPNRVVFVGGSVQDDDRIDHNHVWHHRTFWYVLDRTSPTTCTLRVLLWHSNLFTKDRGYTLEDEATAWDHVVGSSSEDVEFEKLRRLMFARCPDAIYNRDKYLALEP
ncbi:hypothetical protein SDRG_16458 [Saprolegnia diclina VS20]|uniref:BZIP domain-containing protein n=1 Tax=Saprolegnia diclina (strain VS20) TaxID=1156394 RepID=T0R849_SAPDV|nr:hypothetical protein SDRG_16458 [Saprolegnia diclina VS20]EQC25672.1 hypothetical protein SDRG_16458 [Saprolegnia diclina VS20]|eukprot:XP_008620891.1 hypothetical protein SDRG_16458 [Saprolegnia diclina VS20]